jgi:cellulose synthase/poly-beta-1,6-N-acetylglucosamine synthase-like glycosyltransferase
VEILTTGCGLLAAWAALPALDAGLRFRRVGRPLAAARGGERPKRPLVLVPSRGEGVRVGEIAVDAHREAQAAGIDARICVLLDGADPEASARLDSDGISYLSKNPPGPSKGHALAFAAEHLAAGIDASDYVLVFDADMRLPEGFFRDLVVPAGTDAFQLPVRPAGAPKPGAPRVETLSLAAACADDSARDAEGLPVRLRGKAMGFTPKAFRLGPAAATRTTAEDSEATLRLLTAGIRVRALGSPVAFDEPAPASAAMARSRARWFGGHLKLLATGFGDLLRLAGKSPKGAFVLACDLWLRPRLFVLLALAFLAIGSDVALLFFSSKGAWTAAASGGASAASGAGAVATRGPAVLLVFVLLLSLEAKTTLVFEWLLLGALRRRIGYPPEIPAVTLGDLYSSFSMWACAAGLALLAPSRWHRARPPA